MKICLNSADDDNRRYYGRGGYLGRYRGIGIGRFSTVMVADDYLEVRYFHGLII